MERFIDFLFKLFWYVVIFCGFVFVGWLFTQAGMFSVGMSGGLDDSAGGARGRQAFEVHTSDDAAAISVTNSIDAVTANDASTNDDTRTVPVAAAARAVHASENASAEVPVAAVVIEPVRYSTPPLSFDVVHTAASQALVNILCVSSGDSTIQGITGSGVIIDPRGIILTNAHVAQYFLLKDMPDTPMQCTIRTGGPAKNKFTAELLFMPSAWVGEHAREYVAEKAYGTGEHDWALLAITGNVDGTPATTPIPFVTPDTREALVLPTEEVLALTYPAGFVGGSTIRDNFWPVSTIAQVMDLFTFRTGSVDIFSLGGTIVAQSGSSGGPVLNQWGRLIGIVVTATEADTTDKRDLRSVTLSHINESMKVHIGLSLAEFLAGDAQTHFDSFQANSKAVLQAMLTGR